MDALKGTNVRRKDGDSSCSETEDKVKCRKRQHVESESEINTQVISKPPKVKKKKSRKYESRTSSSSSSSDSCDSGRDSGLRSSSHKKRKKERKKRKKDKHSKKKRTKSKKKKRKEKECRTATEKIERNPASDKDIGNSLQDAHSNTSVYLEQNMKSSSDPGTSDVIGPTLLSAKSETGHSPKLARSFKPMTKEEYDKVQGTVRRVFDPESGRHRLVKGEGEILEEIVSYKQHKDINKTATKGDGEYFSQMVGLR